MPTRHGWATLVAGVGCFVVGRLFGLLELYVVGTALLAVLGVSLLVVNRALPRMQVRRIARPSMVSVGEPARVDIQVVNLSQRRTPRLRLWEPVGTRGGAPMQLAPLPSGDSATAAYRVPSRCAGCAAGRTYWPGTARCSWCPSASPSPSPVCRATGDWASTCG